MDRKQAFNRRILQHGYEIWFGTAFDFEQNLAIWFRYSTLLRPGQNPRSAIWISVFDQNKKSNLVRTEGFCDQITSSPDGYSIHGCGFSENHIFGTLGDIQWSFDIEHKHAAESHLSELLMDSPLTATKSIIVSPFCGITGKLSLNQKEIPIRATGCYTHIWGSARVPELYWCFVPQFDNADAGLEFAAVRPKKFLPLIKFVTVRRGSDLIHQTFIDSLSTKVEPCFPNFSAKGRIQNSTFELNASMVEPATRYIYLDPSGTNRYIHQNDSSSASLLLREKHKTTEFTSRNRAAVEFHGLNPWPLPAENSHNTNDYYSKDRYTDDQYSDPYHRDGCYSKDYHSNV